MKQCRYLLWLVIGAMFVLWAWTPLAQAHAIIVNADPQPNSVVASSPQEVWILFSEPIEPAFSNITVLSQAGQQVDNADLTAANENHTAFLVTLPPLAEGTYLVSWRVLSTVDGHTTSGIFSFGVGVEQVAGDVSTISSTAQEPTFFSIGGRWLSLTGVAFLLGMFAFYLFVWRPLLVTDGPHPGPLPLGEGDSLPPQRGGLRGGGLDDKLDLAFKRSALKLGGVFLALLGLGLIFTFISQSRQYNLLNNANAQLWLGTRFGAMWFWRFGLTLLTAGVYLAYFWERLSVANQSPEPMWLWWLGLELSIALALTISLVSHSAALSSKDALLALLVDMVHILAAGVWAGGLIQMGLALWLGRRLPGEVRTWLSWGVVVNFSAVAAIAVGFLLLSGGYLAWQHIGSWTALLGTAYGLTLLTKIGLALPAFALAAVNLLFIKPQLTAALETSPREASQALLGRLRRLVQVEAACVLLILLTTGYLTDLQRGQDAPPLASEPGKVLLSQTVDDLDVVLSLEPAIVGQNQFEVRLSDAAGQPIDDADEVALRFNFLGQSLGTAMVQTTPLGQGRYAAEGGYISLIGPWQVEVSIRRPGAFDTFAPFRMEAGLSGSIRAIGNQNLVEQTAKFLTRSGGSVPGALIILLAIGWFFLARRAAKQDWQLLPLLLPGFVALWLGGFQIYTFYSEFTPTKFVTNPILPDSGSIARGQQLYETHCAACHGSTGRGDGPAAADLVIPPANFAAGHTETHPDGDLYYWIKQGIDGSAMPAFEGQLSNEDVWNLVNYVRRLSVE